MARYPLILDIFVEIVTDYKWLISLGGVADITTRPKIAAGVKLR